MHLTLPQERSKSQRLKEVFVILIHSIACLPSHNRYEKRYERTYFSSSLSCRRNQSELLQHAEAVKLPPHLNNLAVLKTGDTDACHCDLVAARWNAHHFTLLRAMLGKACSHLVALSNHVLYGELQVREYRETPVSELYIAFKVERL